MVVQTQMKGSDLVLYKKYNTAFSLKCQQYELKDVDFNESASSVLLTFKSREKASEVKCPGCGKRVYIQENCTCEMKDIPIFFGVTQTIRAEMHRYRCRSCKKVFTEDLGILRHPGTRITERAATWLRGLVRFHIPISAISSFTGIRWNTVCRIHREYMEEQLEKREKEQEGKKYKPKYLAVDEFAIHKGHTYATCVMDLEEGDVLWVGMGRAKEDFRKFFEEYDLSLLSEVKAIAMDMNASYHLLVEEYLPHADIVYDRYHMQAQFGKDVLGSVRLEEAREHQQRSHEYQENLKGETDTVKKQEMKKTAREELRAYSKIKSSRWNLLMSAEKLNEKQSESLQQILDNHSKLALCYAIKEEMCELFKLDDPHIARQKWNAWFKAAKESGIPQLMKFAELKEKRLDGLVAHAVHPISTGKLEGFNNKIKVAKRIAYGFRNDDYFFTLIQYLSLPSVRRPFHTYR